MSNLKIGECKLTKKLVSSSVEPTFIQEEGYDAVSAVEDTLALLLKEYMQTMNNEVGKTIAKNIPGQKKRPRQRRSFNTEIILQLCNGRQIKK